MNDTSLKNAWIELDLLCVLYPHGFDTQHIAGCNQLAMAQAVRIFEANGVSQHLIALGVWQAVAETKGDNHV